MHTHPRHPGIPLALTLVALIGALALLGTWGYGPPAARAQAGVIRVATTGTNAPGCGSAGSPCQTIQYAVNRAVAGDEIRVAGGTYAGVQTHPVPPGYPQPPASGVIAQVVYVDQAVTIRGGYTTANWTTPNPALHPTILNAQDLGRGMFVSGTVTIEGLRVISGSAAGLGGHPYLSADAGGGIYLYRADDATLTGNEVYGNRATSGGGLYLYYGDNVALTSNTVSTNTASTTYYDMYGGGGLYLYYSSATLMDNTITGNKADSAHGGGLYLRWSDVTLIGNTIAGNRSYWDGGGVHLHGGDTRLNGNTIADNRTLTEYGDGGGLCLDGGTASLTGNAIAGNTALASHNAWDGGGGLFLNGVATLSQNLIVSNTATQSGGGLALRGDATLDNNVIADNVIGTEPYGHPTGAGVHVYQGYLQGRHNTLARNQGGDGSGLYVTDDGYGRYSTVALTNTIIVSHTVGITVAAGSTATLQATLWHANGSNWVGTGLINHTGDVPGDPDPAFAADGADAAYPYHLTAGSPAADTGVNAHIWADVDGQPRPYQIPDLGADEYWPPGVLKHVYFPLTLRQFP